MSKRYSDYFILPGVNHVVTCIPQKHQHIPVDGVQAFSYEPTSETQSYQEYGTVGTVLRINNFTGVTGSMEIKDLANGTYLARALTDQDPDTSFVYDPSQLEEVDFIFNKMNSKRDKVVRSLYLFEALPKSTYGSSLNEAEERNLDFEASRALEFEGHQVAVVSFGNTIAGQTHFMLPAPAKIPVDSDMCPITFAIRVWVDGTILHQEDQATLVTQLVSGTEVTTLILETPLAKDGQIVKVAWLVDGNDPLDMLSGGMTLAPVMINILPQITGPAGATVWDGTLEVFFSKPFDPTITINATDFEFVVTNPAVETLIPVTIDQVNLTVNNTGVKLEFDPADVAKWAGAKGTLVYKGTTIKDTDNHITPPHSRDVVDWTTL
jgi:hypothetical protein